MSDSVPLGEIASVFNGKTPSKAEKRSVGHPVLKIKDVTEAGEFCGEFDSFVDPDFAEKHKKKTVRKNDVLVLNAAHNADYVGSKMLKAPSEVEGAIATGEWLLVRTENDSLDQSYLWYWFQSPNTRFRIRERVKGIHLYPRDVAELKVPLPPIDKQQRIAAILDKADDIRRKRQQVLRMASDLLKSLSQQAFRNAQMIDSVPLGEVASVFNGKTPSKAEKRSAGHPVLKIKDVTKVGEFCGEFDSFVDPDFAERYEKRAVQRNDALVLNAAHNADYVGSKMLKAPSEVEGAIATGEWLLVRTENDSLDQSYLWYWFQSPNTRFRIRERVKGIHLYPRDVAELKVPLPPIDKQQHIAAILDKVDNIRRKRQQALILADDLLKSLSQRAFHGEL